MAEDRVTALPKEEEEGRGEGSRDEQSSVITEITDQKLKPEPEPNRTALVRFGFGFVFQKSNSTEPNRISYPIYHLTQIQFSESYSS